jgi:hypothetical protein
VNLRLQRAHLARLDHRRAAGRKSIGNLVADEPGIGVPGRNQPGHPDRLHDNFGISNRTNEAVGLQRLRRDEEGFRTIACGPPGSRHRCAILEDRRLFEIGGPRQHGVVQTAQQLKPFRLAGAGIRRQGALGRLDRPTGVFGVREPNLSNHLATRRIEQSNISVP